ncbi:MAG: M24 family metallopeptidase [Bdellovibrionota bacterium]
MAITPEENVKKDFRESEFLDARTKVWMLIEDFASHIRPGMLESEAKIIGKEILVKEGISQSWHAPQVRFGSHTLKSFGEPVSEDLRLGDNDIFFLDLGLVWNGYEADAGRTFVVGSDVEHLKCRDDARRIFEEVATHWSNNKVSGVALYDFAIKSARSRGWILNLDLNGHRLGDFPHALVHKGSLQDFAEVPSPKRWVLEIQIRHPSKSFGAFFEDLLI